MFTPKISVVFKALVSTWLVWVAVILLILLIGGCAWVFSAGSTVLGVVLVFASITYLFVLIYMIYYVTVMALIVGNIFSLFTGGTL